MAMRNRIPDRNGGAGQSSAMIGGSSAVRHELRQRSDPMEVQMVDTQKTRQDLTVKGESVERVFGNYQAWRYIVNRRYQRKLVWTLDEKGASSTR